jgi:hypothetical protein
MSIGRGLKGKVEVNSICFIKSGETFLEEGED